MKTAAGQRQGVLQGVSAGTAQLWMSVCPICALFWSRCLGTILVMQSLIGSCSKQWLVKELSMAAVVCVATALSASGFCCMETRRGLLTAGGESLLPIPSCDSCLSEGTRPERFSEWTLLSPLEEKFMWVQFLGQEDPLVKGMATPSSILAWEIPWTEEPGGLQSLGLRRVGYDSVHGHTNVVLVSAAPQRESAVCVHMPPPSSLSSNPPPHSAPLGHDRAPS